MKRGRKRGRRLHSNSSARHSAAPEQMSPASALFIERLKMNVHLDVRFPCGECALTPRGEGRSQRFKFATLSQQLLPLNCWVIVHTLALLMQETIFSQSRQFLRHQRPGWVGWHSSQHWRGGGRRIRSLGYRTA